MAARVITARARGIHTTRITAAVSTAAPTHLPMVDILAATAAEEMEVGESSGELPSFNLDDVVSVLIKKCLSHPISCKNASGPLESSC
ncbi:MAG TPA: hypothetical protein VJS65_00860 [Verrucomicrobiae bacterium]|nr:hypothetical protein [Verrucomicrobiae bacterium]